MEKLLIAVQSELFAEALTAALQTEYDIHTCTDGCDALTLLNTFQPDALILYLRLPRKDGLTVLEQASHTPKIILGILDNTVPYIERRAELAGIQYLTVMPTVNSVVSHLTKMRLDNRQVLPDPQLQAFLLLHTLGLDVKLDGWKMLRAGIPLFAADPGQTLSKVLYPAIAAAVGATDGRAVEHAIRDCIAKAWKRRDHFVWMKYFPPDKTGNIPCPTNSQFIKTLAQHICL